MLCNGKAKQSKTCDSTQCNYLCTVFELGEHCSLKLTYTHTHRELYSDFEGDLGIGRWIRHRFIVAVVVVALTNKPARLQMN